MLKLEKPSPEELAFAEAVNATFDRVDGCSVTPMAWNDDGSKQYGMVFSHGSRRRILRQDAPFHYDPVDEMVARVRRWVTGIAQRERYTTDEAYAE